MQIKSNNKKINLMILIFFLQYFIYFGEVILSPLIYFNMKYFRREKQLKPKILVPKFDKNQIWKPGKSPTLSEGPWVA